LISFAVTDPTRRCQSCHPPVELAAYRIASEAINNALTHSEGSRCLVTITANGTLAVTVRDDGRPPTSWTPGVGLRSILERAEELGGTAAAGPTGDGWKCVHDCRWTGSHHPSTITLLGVDPLACLAAPADRYLTDHERL
jgi:signal transduction histidine kinase